jgi:hypothetical protein
VQPRAALSHERQLLLERAVRRYLDHVHVLLESPVAIDAVVADAPDEPDLLRIPPQRLGDVRVLDPNGVDELASVSLDRGAEDGQGDAPGEYVEVRLGVGDGDALLRGEVADVEGAVDPLCGADAFDVHAERREHPLADSGGRAECRIRGPRQQPSQWPHRRERQHLQLPPAFARFLRRHSGQQHRQVEGAARRAVGVVEAQSCLLERHEHTGLVGNPDAAAGQEQRSARRDLVSGGQRRRHGRRRQ